MTSHLTPTEHLKAKFSL